ncbi:MAG: hypothetical protein QXP34_00345 [Candidatus Aenigmatarchaeota archaeon]
MLALDTVFLVLIAIVTIIAVSSLILAYKDKVIDFFYRFFSKEEDINYCYTTYYEGIEDVTNLCKICLNLGKKLKNNCYCFVIYSSNVYSDLCENRCSISNNKIWLIKYDISENKVFIEC